MRSLKHTIKEFLIEGYENKKVKLKMRLLGFGGTEVKLGMDSEDELDRILFDGMLFDNDVIRLNGGFGQCHKNVATKYKKFKSDGFRIISGYALSDNDIWVQHSWGLNSSDKIMETTGNNYQKYYGYILNESESDEFCFYNY